MTKNSTPPTVRPAPDIGEASSPDHQGGQFRPELLHSRNGNGKHRPTVLVTGGAGYLGSHLTRQLLAADYSVRILDSFLFGNQGVRELQDDPRVEVIEGDVRHIDDLADAIPGCDAVIHLAAIVGDPACAIHEEVTRTVNYEATKLLVEMCNHYRTRRLIFASSCSVYGASDSLVLNEGSLLNPLSLYARTRVQSENILLTRCCDETAVSILRLSTLFGLSARMRYDLVVNLMSAQAARERHVSVTGGNQWRPLVHVADAARAFVTVVQAQRELIDRQIYNVGASEQNYTIAGIAECVCREVPGVTLSNREGDPQDHRNYRVSSDKIRHVLGFQPQRSLQQGISEIAEDIGRRADCDYSAAQHHNNKIPYRFTPRRAAAVGRQEAA